MKTTLKTDITVKDITENYYRNIGATFLGGWDCKSP